MIQFGAMSTLISHALKSVRLARDSLVSVFYLMVAGLLPALKIEIADLTGKTAIVTGANSGIGYSLALSLAKRNATVYLACRSTSKAKQAAAQIIEACGESSSKRVRVFSLDTSSLDSVRAFAAAWGSQPIDILIHNAGIASTSADNRTTAEGLGTIYATNFLGSFLLTSLLEPNLSLNARVILTSSTGQYSAAPRRLFTMPRLAPAPSKRDGSKSQPSDSALYADTKFMQVAFASLLQQRFDAAPNNRRLAHAFTPGYTFTPIFEKTTSLPGIVDPLYLVLKACTALSLPVEQGAATGLWLATTKDPEVIGIGSGGRYWDRCVRRSTAVDALPEGELERMWHLWEVDAGAKWL